MGRAIRPGLGLKACLEIGWGPAILRFMIPLVKETLLKLLSQQTYVPSNVPELLRLLRLPPRCQQELQRVLRELEQAGQLVRIKGNRYVLPLEADLVPGRIRMNRQGKGFLIPDDSSLKEIAV